MAEVCVYTHNMKLFYRITHKFRMEHLPFVALDDFSDIFPTAKVLLTTQCDLDKYDPFLPENLTVFLVQPSMFDDEILLKTIQFLHSIYCYKSITIGIDPGSHMIGVAIFLNDWFIYSREILDLYQLKQILQVIFHTFPNRKRILKIGNGVRHLTIHYLRFLIKNQFDLNAVECHIVNESHTTKKPYCGKRAFSSKHEKAAMFIGRRSGEIVNPSAYAHL